MIEITVLVVLATLVLGITHYRWWRRTPAVATRRVRLPHRHWPAHLDVPTYLRVAGTEALRAKLIAVHLGRDQ